MSLNSLLEIVRARRQAVEAGGVPRTLCIWDDGDGGEQQITDMLASGKAKATDKLVAVRWSTPEECELGIAPHNADYRR